MIYFWKRDGEIRVSLCIVRKKIKSSKEKIDLLSFDDSSRSAILDNEGGSASETDTNRSCGGDLKLLGNLLPLP